MARKRRKSDEPSGDAPDQRQHADNMTASRRLDDVIRIRLQGAKFWDLREFVREKEQEKDSAWFLEAGQLPLSDVQLRRYQTAADRAIEASVEKDRQKIVSRSLARREDLYARAVLAGEIRTALAVDQDTLDIVGGYPDPKTSGTDDAPFYPPQPKPAG
jgi:hypothetical protein